MSRKKMDKQERLNALKVELEQQKQKKSDCIHEIDKKVEDLQAEKKTRTMTFDNKIKKISLDIEKLENTISLETMKDIHNIISLKGISMNELLTALQTGDLLSLQEQMEMSSQIDITVSQAGNGTAEHTGTETSQTDITVPQANDFTLNRTAGENIEDIMGDTQEIFLQATNNIFRK